MGQVNSRVESWLVERCCRPALVSRGEQPPVEKPPNSWASARRSADRETVRIAHLGGASGIRTLGTRCDPRARGLYPGLDGSWSGTRLNGLVNVQSIEATGWDMNEIVGGRRHRTELDRRSTYSTVPNPREQSGSKQMVTSEDAMRRKPRRISRRRVTHTSDEQQALSLPPMLPAVGSGLEKWCPGAESNHRHADFQSAALPTELPGLVRRQLYRGALRACPAAPRRVRRSGRTLDRRAHSLFRLVGSGRRSCSCAAARRGRRQPVSAASDRPGAPACRYWRSPPSARAPGAHPRAAAPRGSPASARRPRSGPAPARERRR